MTTINLTADDFTYLFQLADQGKTDIAKVSEAWRFLGEVKNDGYAYLAASIVSNDTSTMSSVAQAFYELVRIRWNNTPGAGLWGSDVFRTVGAQHLTNYLELLSRQLVPGTTDSYTLPNTEQIEASYKDALQKSFLPPITSIDSLFSVLDTAAGNAGGSYVDSNLNMDFSWAWFLKGANWWLDGPSFELDRIVYNSDVFAGCITPLQAAIDLGRDVVNAIDAVGAGAVVQLTPLAPAYWMMKFVDGAIDYTIVDFVNQQAVLQLLKTLDPTVTSEMTAHLLMASDADDHIAFANLIDRLGRTLNLDLPSSSTNRAQLFTNVKTIGDTFTQLKGSASHYFWNNHATSPAH